LGYGGQRETGQRHANETEAEFLQRRATRNRLSHVLGEFIEFVVHVLSILKCAVPEVGLIVSISQCDVAGRFGPKSFRTAKMAVTPSKRKKGKLVQGTRSVF
jgi:hypothetical protein